MKLFPIISKDGTQGNLFIGVLDKDMSKAEKERGTTLAADALHEWKVRALEWISSLEVGDTFTADDLIANVGLPTYYDDRPNNNGVGGLISGLAKTGAIHAAGYTTSERITNHARVLRIWRVG